MNGVYWFKKMRRGPLHAGHQVVDDHWLARLKRAMTELGYRIDANRSESGAAFRFKTGRAFLSRTPQRRQRVRHSLDP
jgi:hypothetical protein